MRSMRPAAVFLIVTACAWPQAADTKQRIRAIRDLGKLGSESIATIAPYLSDPAPEIRVEAVKAIVAIGGGRSIDPLVAAAADNDPEVQILAADGLVNFYSPGYLKTGLSGSLKRAGTALRGKFGDANDLVVEPYVQVKPEAIAALGKLARGGVSMESRANAARALGVLRGRAALDDLYAALRSKDDQVLYESLVAIRKIRDPESGPRVIFLMRDLNDRVQIAAIEAAGVLGAKEAIPGLIGILKDARNEKARRAALTSLAMLPDERNRPLYAQHLASNDEGLRAAAAEGLARLKQPADLPLVAKAFDSETKMNARLSLAFAAVSLGRNDLGEFGPLRYLVSTLNSTAHRGIAQPFLSELAQDPGVRRTLYAALPGATRYEKIHLGQIFARAGDQESMKYLEKLAADPDTAVAEEGVRALKTLRSRM